HRWDASPFPSCLAFHPEGQQLALGSLKSSAVEVRETATGKLLGSFPYPAIGVRQLAWHPACKLLAAIWEPHDFTSPVWTGETGQLQLLEGHHARLDSIVSSHHGDLLASHAWDETYRLWNPFTGKQLLSAPAECVAAQFSPDDRWLTCATDAL